MKFETPFPKNFPEIGDIIRFTCTIKRSHTAGFVTAEQITGEDVRITLVKDGDHRLSRPQDLDLLCNTLGDTLAALRNACSGQDSA